MNATVSCRAPYFVLYVFDARKTDADLAGLAGGCHVDNTVRRLVNGLLVMASCTNGPLAIPCCVQATQEGSSSEFGSVHGRVGKIRRSNMVPCFGSPEQASGFSLMTNADAGWLVNILRGMGLTRFLG